MSGQLMGEAACKRNRCDEAFHRYVEELDTTGGLHALLLVAIYRCTRCATEQRYVIAREG